ncbi:2-amino-4-hydroxy-6-hydroxymethyldihydropteridine diphosphokinase [Microbaculum marinisediminis]|uniref:2-amino-4-hydroxy-6-hydroxymethyldihydropteridine pyrophosphokinase n=1 Tax=Microbaculum marinisediminis TaxID=2931392 RepID=A0AAW5QYM1_9HYPH|nr:2-amino-4-hydroxy-6-hydroxymethyldihydropteridine diphosphokinase [Microbaculum sp. A6E488]MCT8972669.1 2-amino-4-hydroxy-6-hydroxymethyldihydropteridine diphosphokinase [Microbaculum sp. A6E488]
MTEVGFSLGSNIGDKTGRLIRALEALFAGPDLAFVACSSFYKTAPWGYADQDWFVNLCAVGETSLPPERLLALCKHVEQVVGRQDTFRWGPRVIDVDILYYGGDEISEPGLAIPHRELFNRGFVLVPLAEIRPGLVLSGRVIGEEATRFADEAMEIVAPPWAPAEP